jgi:shikimate kinase
MPGSGKTKIGQLISKKLAMGFVDMDECIEEFAKMSTKEMFAISEKYFRDMETECSIALSKLSSHVISSGGGIVKRKENIDYLRRNSTIVFLNRPIENIINDIDIGKRPLLAGGKETLYELYNERYHLYKEYCDIEVFNDRTITEAADEIIKKVKEYAE